MHSSPHIAIVGASGAVGVEILRVMERRQTPVGKLSLVSSARSAGKTLTFRGQDHVLQDLASFSFSGVDIALFSAGSGTSREHAPRAVAAGAVVIDNSSAFRMDDAVPLVIPEINAEDARSHRGLIANPNCTTAVALMALAPLHRAFGLKFIIAASYQAVSGTGAAAIIELREQMESFVAGGTPTPRVYQHPIVSNVIPQVEPFLASGYTKEEMKLQNESRRILHLPGFRASTTCVRVPVFRAHSVAITAAFERPVSLDDARAALSAAPGIDLVDEPSEGRYPMPLTAAGKDNCEVGRLRLDSALENALAFWVCGDQLLKGAALNAVQIAELLDQPVTSQPIAHSVLTSS